MKKWLKMLEYFIIIGMLSNLAHAKNHKKNYQSSIPVYQPIIVENGSYKGQLSEKTYKPKNTYIRNYQRKDGTQVRRHYRSKNR